jgi:hypothetical protein
MGEVVLEVNDLRIPKMKVGTLNPIKAGKSGNVEVTHEHQSSFVVFGQKRRFGERVVSKLVKIMKVYEEHSVLSGRMVRKEVTSIEATDEPESVYRIWNHVSVACGRVLVLGLALGVFHRLAGQASRIDTIHTVELNPHVLALVSPHLKSRRCTFEEGGIDAISGRFDCIFLGETQSLKEANRIAKKVRKHLRPGGKITSIGYREKVMAFQEYCQRNLLNMARDEYADLTAVDPGERHFIEWARRNKKRVLVRPDFKFINGVTKKMAEQEI